MHRRTISFFVTAVAVVSLTACSSKGENGATEQAGKAAAKPNVVTVHAKDFAFEMPSEIAAGMTTFEMINDGPAIHHMTILKLDGGKTYADFQAAIQKGPLPNWAIPVGGPNAPDPTKQSNATLDMAAGEYAVVCLVDVPDKTPHIVKGMMHPLSVKPAAGATVSAPKADIVVTATDYGFAFSKPLTAGTHTIAFVNNAQQPHEIEIIKLAPGKTPKDVFDWMDKPQGPPPGSTVGGISPVVKGITQTFTGDFTPADYLIICFIPDAKDGKPHFVHGMMQVEKVS